MPTIIGNMISTISYLSAIWIIPTGFDQYDYFDDGVTYLRKGIRLVGSDEMFGVDVKLTPAGWAGVEDTDFEMIYPIIV